MSTRLGFTVSHRRGHHPHALPSHRSARCRCVQAREGDGIAARSSAPRSELPPAQLMTDPDHFPTNTTAQIGMDRVHLVQPGALPAVWSS